MNSDGPVFDLLFFRIRGAHSVREQQLANTVALVDRLTRDVVLSGDQDQLVAEIVNAGSANVPVLDRGNISYRRTERETVVQGPFGDRVWRNEPVYLFEIPFKGDVALFDMQPAQYDMNPPRGEATGTVLTVAVTGQEDPEVLKREVDETLDHIQRYLDWHRHFWAGFDQQLESAVRQRFNQRREALKAQDNTAQTLAGMGFKPQ